MRCLIGFALMAAAAAAQTAPRQVEQVLKAPLITPDVVSFQLRQYLLAKAPALPKSANAGQWSADARRLRQHLLNDVVFHGWPRAWVDAPLKYEDLGTIPSGPGYRTRKLRYAIVPGFHATAILYEPDPLPAKAPAILNVNGHVGPPGKSVEYKQKRCINQARRGILSLNLEWFSYGELAGKQNEHWFAAHLDLAGANGVGLFYLAMRKGLDILEQHPNVDRTRLGVTGLSGGGWQTIVLSALDERVAVSVPVAGYSSLVSRLERPGDVGDMEQNATDFLQGQDYSHLTAMRAPRPTLLVYNAEDDCCFRAPLVKPYVYDAVKPFYRLFDAEADLAWHENTDPSNHNYQLDNRIQSYRFFGKHFKLKEPGAEIPSDGEIKSAEELQVGLPPGNLTILELARKMAGTRQERTDGKRLHEIVRYRPAAIQHAWAATNTKSQGWESRSYRFQLDNGLPAAGVWMKAIAATAPSQSTILLHDEGKAAVAAEASERINRGELVLAADLLLTGDAAPQRPGPSAYTQLISTVGERPLGLEAAQLIALAEWLRPQGGKLRVETSGIRTQTVALVAAALRPGLFSEIVVRKGMRSFHHLLETPVEYQAAPDLFCLDLYKEYDLSALAKLAAPTVVQQP